MNSRRQRIEPTAETDYGQAVSAGKLRGAARKDHSHGTPSDISAAHRAADSDVHGATGNILGDGDLDSLTLTDCILDGEAGTKVGGAATDKVGFFGVTPVVQPAAAAQAALTDSTGGTTDGTIDDCSTVVTGVDGTGNNAASKADVDTRLATINNNLAEVAVLLNQLRNDIVTLGLIKGST